MFRRTLGSAFSAGKPILNYWLRRNLNGVDPFRHPANSFRPNVKQRPCSSPRPACGESTKYALAVSSSPRTRGPIRRGFGCGAAGNRMHFPVRWWLWVPAFVRRDDASFCRHTSAFPRRRLRPSCAYRSALEDRGRRECRMRQQHPQPRVQNEKSTRASHHRFAGSPAFPAQWF